MLSWTSSHPRCHGKQVAKVCFEITETASISNLGAAAAFVSILETPGCRFALDGIGSGLCSFGDRKDLPPDHADPAAAARRPVAFRRDSVMFSTGTRRGVRVPSRALPGGDRRSRRRVQGRR